MRGRAGGLSIILQRFRTVAQFLMALCDHALHVGIGWQHVLEIRECRLVVAGVERDVSGQIEKIGLLFRDSALVQNGSGGRDVFTSLLHFAPADGNPRPRMGPPEIPEILAIGRKIRLLEPGIVASFVPGVGGTPVAGIETDAAQFVGGFAGVIEIPGRQEIVVGVAVGLLGAPALH